MLPKNETPAPSKATGVEVSSSAMQDSVNSTPKPVRLPPEVTRTLLDQLPERACQARRLILNLANNPDSPTGHLNRDSGVNLSSVARRYNPLIKKYGYYIDCRLPPSPIINGYGEKSGQRLWGIYPIADTTVKK